VDERALMQAVRERQGEVREEIVRHRFGARVSVRHARGRVHRWRRALGRLFVSFGRAIEGEEAEARSASLPCS
jgi:hypothetical protein